jgi:transposase InsO family protein
MIIALVDEAVAEGARRAAACDALDLDVRTVERWRAGAHDDRRCGSKCPPKNKLSDNERRQVLAVMTSPQFRNMSPNQIVPLLADEGRFIASEATMYRILREEELLHHRGRAKAPVRRAPTAHVATGPNQVWSWDITYLKSPVRGVFFYLYMFVDVWSRKIVGWDVHEAQSDELAAEAFEDICALTGVDPIGIVLHADNGGPMKGSTMVATLERLGVMPSFSRPSVSNDNAYSEALFRTLKYRPEFPTKPFFDVDAARAWVASFVTWYNDEHLHSGINFVTPGTRHAGIDVELLANRHATYEAARAAHPERWTMRTRNWEHQAVVYLNSHEPGRRGASTGASAAVLTASEPERSAGHPKGRSEAEEARSALTGEERRLSEASPGAGQARKEAA